MEEVRGAYRRMMRAKHVYSADRGFDGGDASAFFNQASALTASKNARQPPFDIRQHMYLKHLETTYDLHMKKLEQKRLIYHLESRVCELEGRERLHRQDLELSSKRNESTKQRSHPRRCGVEEELKGELEAAFVEKERVLVDLNKVNHDIKWIRDKIDDRESTKAALSDGVDAITTELGLVQTRGVPCVDAVFSECSIARECCSVGVQTSTSQGNAQVEALEGELKSTKRKLEYLYEDVKDANSLSEKKTSEMRALRMELNIVKSEKESVEMKYWEQSQLIPDVQKVFSAMEQVKNSCDAITARLVSKDEVVASYRKMRDNFHHLRSEHEKLQGECDGKDRRISELRESEKSLKRLRDEVERKEQAVEDVKRLERKNESLVGKLRQAEETLVQMRKVLVTREEEIARLIGVENALGACKVEVEELKGDLAKVGSERDTLKKELKTLNDYACEAVSLRSKCDTLTKRVEEFGQLQRKYDDLVKTSRADAALLSQFKRLIASNASEDTQSMQDQEIVAEAMITLSQGSISTNDFEEAFGDSGFFYVFGCVLDTCCRDQFTGDCGWKFSSRISESRCVCYCVVLQQSLNITCGRLSFNVVVCVCGDIA